MNKKQRDKLLLKMQEEDERRDELLLKMQEEDERRDKLLLKMQEEDKHRDELLLNMQEEDKRRDELLQKIVEELRELKGEVNELKELKGEVNEIKEEQKRQGNTLTRIEVEHGEKLSALLDAFKFHSEKLQSHENRFEKDEKLIDRNSNEIFYLKSQIQS